MGDEADIAMAVASGESETEVMALNGLTFEQLDQIMDDHNFMKCQTCKEWIGKEDLDGITCPACGGEA